MNVQSEIKVRMLRRRKGENAHNLIAASPAPNNIAQNQRALASSLTGCFAEGTLIETSNGPVPIECLSARVMVRTFKNGIVPLQNVVCIPSMETPKALCSLEAGYLDTTRPLLTTAFQPVRLTHWLGMAMFQTRFPFVRLGHVNQIGKVDRVETLSRKLFRIDLGITDAIYANGAMCIVESYSEAKEIYTESRKMLSFNFRLIREYEVKQVLDANTFFRIQRRLS